ncbi:hypothetical protein QL285_062833 [Trifolium repens]|nr:hypothetical protein QL285_062833 [Trifolium repens]
MFNVRRSFRRLYAFVFYVRRDARELSTCLVLEDLIKSCDLIIKCNSPGECLLAGASVTGHEHARASSTAICKEIVILCLDVPPMIFVFNAVCGGISSTLGSLLLERCLLVIVLGDKLEDLKSFDDVLNI